MSRAYTSLLQSIVSVLTLCIGFSAELQAVAMEWPESITYPADITVHIIREAPTTEGSLYHSNHFELISDHPLSRKALCDVLRVLEASYASLLALPLGFEYLPSKQRRVVKLVDSQQHYIDSGGILGSGGVYLSESREAVVRFETLGAKRSKEGRITSIQNLGLIAHEVTHQIQHDWLDVLPIWLIEGMAVYLESVPFQQGTLLFKNMHFRSEKHIRRCSENQYWITDIQKLMTLDRDEWNQHFQNHPSAHNQHYVSAFLLTYYFLHMSGDEPGSHLRTYIQAMKVADHPEAQQSALTQLMSGRTYQMLENDLITAYAQAGLQIQALIDASF
ncbi:hypothetical protein SH580_02260 [Coraliomargarita algicola]|uniref:DUF1570 domain-containing protein n=1 Tax=Coraliomargarita algicola TaxID=3092156 RepID=A0ABZ0RMA5_9BACT|nr:hypothetical protein [Coraliomargarita sp. J2-16]WPJ96526.1 hypothetical protein SH580_02260 [Coraliomargarita sp. J2-16]